MNKIAIITGDGLLPLSIGKSLLKKKYDILFLGIKNFADSTKYQDYNYTEINLTSISDILKILNSHKINYIIMAGKISRPSLKDLNFDFNTMKLIKNFLLESKGDDQLLKIISNFFLDKGYPLFDWKNVCDDLFSKVEYLSLLKPSVEAVKNKNKGLNIFKIIGNADIGQSIVVQNQLILGIECAEGTDKLIQRCSNYEKKGDKKILIKLSKYNQHLTLDLPTIGLNTIKNLYQNNYEGIFIEKNQCVILEKNLVIDFCNKKNLFLSTINKIV